jgi:large subunit ribosomal protein L21
MDFAVIETGGKQYQVSVGDELDVELVPGKAGDKVTLEKVLLIKDGETVKIGKPYLAGVALTAQIVDQKKAGKIRVARYRAKSRHRRVIGHRQRLTRVKVLKLVQKTTAKKRT